MFSIMYCGVTSASHIDLSIYEHVEDDVLRMGKRVCDEEVWSGDVLPPGGEVLSYPGCRIPVAMNKFLLRYLVEFKGFR